MPHLKVIPLSISTLAPTRGATRRNEKMSATGRFQLSPLHEGRLQDLEQKNASLEISTLAPTRGATK